jgi:hypothetical protein
MWLYVWRDKNEYTFKDQKETVVYLNKLYYAESFKGIMFVNNDPMLEVLSRIDYKAFNHFWMRENQETYEYLMSLKISNENVYIITNAKMIPYLIKFGNVVYESDHNQNNPDRIIILKI